MTLLFASFVGVAFVSIAFGIFVLAIGVFVVFTVAAGIGVVFVCVGVILIIL